MTLLTTTNMAVTFGGLRAVDDVDFEVRPGQLVGLIGPNGAGKTTFIDGITGFVHTSGRIDFDGADISTMSAHQRARRGLGRTWQSLELFDDLTVRENLELGAFPVRARPHRAASLEWVVRLFPRLAERQGQLAGTLSGGEQQMLAMGRALMSQPKLLMLDEPSMGLSPIMMQKIMETIVELKAAGTTILLVEQNAQAALALADQGHVMEVGKVVLSGTGADLLHDESVRKAYLGED